MSKARRRRKILWFLDLFGGFSNGFMRPKSARRDPGKVYPLPGPQICQIGSRPEIKGGHSPLKSLIGTRYMYCHSQKLKLNRTSKTISNYE